MIKWSETIRVHCGQCYWSVANEPNLNEVWPKCVLCEQFMCWVTMSIILAISDVFSTFLAIHSVTQSALFLLWPFEKTCVIMQNSEFFLVFKSEMSSSLKYITSANSKLNKTFSDQFLGCLENPYIDGFPVSLKNPLVNSGVLLESCPKVSF